jgi:hypothetical protein
MPLVPLQLPQQLPPLPAEVAEFLADVDRRIEAFQQQHCVPGFVPSDFASAYQVLGFLATHSLARGSQFCEWGSGYGVVTCLSTLVGFASCGIEIEPLLVEQARQLADDYQLPAEFARGSFIPRGAEVQVHCNGVYSWLTTEADTVYETLGLEPQDMDVVFAYPWPDEEGVIEELFVRYGGTGSLLVTYHGGEGIRVQRKIRTRRRTHDRRQV